MMNQLHQFHQTVRQERNLNDDLCVGLSETKEEECNLSFRFLLTNQEFTRSFKHRRFLLFWVFLGKKACFLEGGN